jgi:DNA repair protein RadC
MNVSRPKGDRANADRRYRRINEALRLAQSGDAENVLAAALEILATRIKHGDAVNSPSAVREYLRLLLHDRECEIFVVVLLDAQHRVIATEELFRGTLTQTSVYPREVVKLALKYNSAACIFAHNHPSGVAEPSRADELLTVSLKDALALVDIKVLDHIIVAGAIGLSFAEKGLI